MKNLHLLPTEKPSRLLYFGTSKELTLQVNPATFRVFERSTQHIYITSDEEIKEGDWLFSSKTNNIFKADSIEYLESHNMIEDFDKSFYINSKYSKKIILTTDQDLIKDGVQSIEDEFLLWFVKNPSCEEVKTKLVEFEVDTGLGDSCIEYGSYYEIIIPQEELKQETLEEAAAKYVENELQDRGTFDDKVICSIDFTAGAKSDAAKDYWYKKFQEQDKNKYSEEDMKQFAFECVANFLSNNDNKVEIKLVDVIIDRLNFQFKQFKKK